MSTLAGVEIRHLRALRAVADAGTFALAGERLGYTQSAISQQIGALESAAGGAVFDRPGGPRRAILTPLGERLLLHGDDILGRIDAAEADVSRFLAGEVGTLAVGTFQSASVQLLPGVLQRLRRERPDLEVRLSETTDEQELVDWLLSRAVDVAFLSPTPDDEEIELTPLILDPYVVVSSATGGNVDLPGATVAPVELSRMPLVAETASACQRVIEEGLSAHTAELNVVFRTQDNAAVQAMARSGVGHAVMASLAADVDDPGVLIRALDPPIPPRQISIGVLRDRKQPPALRRFIELAQSVSSDLIDASRWLAAPPAVSERIATGA